MDVHPTVKEFIILLNLEDWKINIGEQLESDKKKIVDLSDMPSLEGDEEEVKEGKELNSKQTINHASSIIGTNKSWK